MDLSTPQAIAAIVAGGISLIVSVIGLIVNTTTSHRLHSDKLNADRELAENKVRADQDLAERKFQYDQTLHDHKRKTELAEEALCAFYQVQRVFVWVRSRAGFIGEGSSRQTSSGESPYQTEKRNAYYIPIERINNDKIVFSKIETLKFSFAAHFGRDALTPFDTISSISNEILTASTLLIEITPEAQDERLYPGGAASLLNTIGWGQADRPDEIDRRIEKAVSDIEALCRPVLYGKDVF